MKTIKELETEIEEKKFELKLKDRVDGTNAKFDMNIRILEKQLQTLKDVLKLIDRCSYMIEDGVPHIIRQELKDAIRK